MKKLILWPALLLALATLGTAGAGRAADRTVRVLIWDEQQPAQKQVYENFLGNAIADHLNKVKRSGSAEFTVKSVRLDDPEQGLTKENLDNADVLIWWGHQRHGEVKPETAKGIVERIKSGQLSLLALHSAHFSNPFVEAMNERTRQDALKTLTKAEREKVQIKEIPAQRRLYKADEPVTPSWTKTTNADGTVTLEIKQPSCVFTSVNANGKPSYLKTVAKHPITKGLPENWSVPAEEIYGGPFFVPKPDVTLLDERFETGETFGNSGALWKVGKGHVVYFRPGHETYPIFKQEYPLLFVENAVRWLGAQKK
jgi:trehalose utilization protein